MIRQALAALVVPLTLLALASPIAAEVTDEELAAADRRLAELGLELDELTRDWEEAVHRSAELEYQSERIGADLLDTMVSVTALEEQAKERAVEIYMDAAVSSMAAFFVSDSVELAGASIGYLEEIGKSDREIIRDLEARLATLIRYEGELSVVEADLAIVEADLVARSEVMNSRLEEAQGIFLQLRAQRAAEDEAKRLAAEAEAKRIAEEEARKAAEVAATSTTIPGPPVPTSPTTTVADQPSSTDPPPAPGGSRTCPVDGYTRFTDTWGAARSGGRTHEGVDMLAARGTPVVAIEAGKVKSMRSSTLGGITVWLSGASGDTFYYGHLDSHAPGLSTGQSVAKGALLGYVGTSGNAPEHVPHLHFEHHPGGGSAVNPYLLVKGLCG